MIVIHLIYRAIDAATPDARAEAETMAAKAARQITRHAGIDRLFHWVMAATMTVLLVTSLLPLLGVRFGWYEIHWIAGIVLTVMIVLHIVRALFWQRPRTMLALTPADLPSSRGTAAGKYTLPQKLMHLAWTVAILVAIVTGCCCCRQVGRAVLRPRSLCVSR